MIRVRVTPPPGCCRDRLDDRGWMELPEGARLSDVLREIRLPHIIARILMVSINGEIVKPDRQLCDGDSIGFISVITGG